MPGTLSQFVLRLANTVFEQLVRGAVDDDRMTIGTSTELGQTGTHPVIAAEVGLAFWKKTDFEVLHTPIIQYSTLLLVTNICAH